MTYLKGRGAQINTPNQFDNTHQSDGLIWNDDDEVNRLRKTTFIKTHPKSVVNKVESPDIGMEYSLNPYQGCEHGCVYCYARNTHTYWGYSAGIEFEQKILVKENAPELLQKKIHSKSWKPIPIVLSGNTDCYQPAEREYKLTRSILELMLKYKHPVGIITKNSLILRDLDLLSDLAKYNLLKVSISITTLDEGLRSKLEPRTASAKNRVKTISQLSKAGVPVNVMFAPIIPSINDQEIFQVAEATAKAGAVSFHYTMVRLNGDVGAIFKDWLLKNFPDKYERVVHQIESLHGGQLNDSRFGTRIRGEGSFAEVIRQQVHMARSKFFNKREMPKYNLTLFEKAKTGQLSLF